MMSLSLSLSLFSALSPLLCLSSSLLISSLFSLLCVVVDDVVVPVGDLRRWNVYDHKHTTTMHQSLRLIDVGQCLCTDPYPTAFIMPTVIYMMLAETPNSGVDCACMGHNMRHGLSTLLHSA